MPKIKKLRKHNLNFNPYENIDSGDRDEVDHETELVLSKGQRKRQENKAKVMRKIGLISPINNQILMNRNVKKKKEKNDILYSELESNLKKNISITDDNNNESKFLIFHSLLPYQI